MKKVSKKAKKIVAKKVRKKSVKNKPLKNVSKERKAKKKGKMKSRAQIQKEFHSFAEKVGELESLKRELNGINAKGFESDKNLIRSKLHDIKAVPQVRRDIKALRMKIRRKHVSRAGKTRVNIKLVKKSKAIEGKIRVLESKIKKKKVKQLSSEQVSDVKDIPKLERQMALLKREFDEHNKRTKMQIDSGVGVIVSTKFGDFLEAIKMELSERLKQKEASIDRGLRIDMDDREKVFAKRYANLVEEFHRRYKNKVHDELRSEVKIRFNTELNSKLEEEKKKLFIILARESASSLSSKRKALEMLDENRFAKIVGELRTKMQNDVKIKVAKGLNAKERELKFKLQRSYDSKFKSEIGRKSVELDRRRVQLEEHIAKQARELRSGLKSREAKLRGDLKSKEMKLRGGLKSKEAELEKRKAEIEEKVVKQARSMFK